MEGGSNPCGICCVAVFGIVLFVGGMCSAGWNEYRSVATQKMIDMGRDQVVSVHCGPVQPMNNGKLIHFECPITGEEKLGVGMFGISPVEGLQLRSTVEVYQWVHDSDTVEEYNHKQKKMQRYERKVWKKKWVAGYAEGIGPQSMSELRYPEEWDKLSNPSMHVLQNLSWWSDTLEPGSHILESAPDVRAGEFRMPAELLSDIVSFHQLTPACTPCPRGVSAAGHALLYKYSLGHGLGAKVDEVGDARAVLEVGEADFASVLAQQQVGGTLAPWVSPHDKDYAIFTAEPRAVSAAELLDKAEHDNVALTWGLRLVTWACSILGLLLVLSPLTSLADSIPLLGDCAGALVGSMACVFSCLVGSVCWLTLVGLAWLAYRPLIGLPLLAVACIASGVAYYHRDAFRKTEDQAQYTELGADRKSVV